MKSGGIQAKNPSEDNVLFTRNPFSILVVKRLLEDIHKPTQINCFSNAILLTKHKNIISTTNLKKIVLNKQPEQFY